MLAHQTFGLSRSPFENKLDIRFYYGSTSHREALATLQYASQVGKSLTLLQGGHGTGKSLLARLILGQTQRHKQVVFLDALGLSTHAPLVRVFEKSGVVAPPRVVSLHDWLSTAQRTREPSLVLVDNAEELPGEGWDWLEWVIARDAFDHEPTRSFVLMMAPSPHIADTWLPERMQNRMFRVCQLQALRRDETSAYIAKRLAAAGGKTQLFHPNAIERIHHLTGGVPVRINQICDNALLEAFSESRRHVTVTDIVYAHEAAQLPAPPADITPVWPVSARASAPSITFRDRMPGGADRAAALTLETAQAGPGSNPAQDEAAVARLSELERRLAHALTSVRSAQQRIDERGALPASARHYPSSPQVFGTEGARRARNGPSRRQHEPVPAALV